MVIFYNESICPACATAIRVSRLAFRSDFRCPHCIVALRVSPPYTWTLFMISISLGYAIAWKIWTLVPAALVGIPWLFLVFFIALAFFILIVVIRVGILLIPPTIVVRGRSDSLTKLNLTAGSRKDGGNRGNRGT